MGRVHRHTRDFVEREEACFLALASMRVNMISRGKRRSAVAAAAYRSGEKIYCEYHDRTFFYPRKAASVIHTQIFLPENAPERLRDRAVLWNEVEWIEPNSNSRLAREIRIALHCELTREQNIALAQDFTQRLVDMGMCADLCVHAKGDKNIHAHILLTTRPFNKDGTWGAKSKKAYLLDDQGEKIKLSSGEYKSYKVPTTNWDEKKTYLELRQLYQDITNEHLEKADLATRISVKSYADQGLDKEPTKYLGPCRSRLERQGFRTELGDLNRDIVARNQLRAALQQRFDKWVEQAQVALKQESAQIEAQQQELFRQVALGLAPREEQSLSRHSAVLHRGDEAVHELANRPNVHPNGWKIKAKKDWQFVRKQRKEQTERNEVIQQRTVTEEGVWQPDNTWKRQAISTLQQEAEKCEQQQQELFRQVATHFEDPSTCHEPLHSGRLPTTVLTNQMVRKDLLTTELQAIVAVAVAKTSPQEIPSSIIEQISALEVEIHHERRRKEFENSLQLRRRVQSTSWGAPQLREPLFGNNKTEFPRQVWERQAFPSKNGRDEREQFSRRWQNEETPHRRNVQETPQRTRLSREIRKGKERGRSP